MFSNQIFISWILIEDQMEFEEVLINEKKTE